MVVSAHRAKRRMRNADSPSPIKGRENFSSWVFHLFFSRGDRYDVPSAKDEGRWLLFC